MRTLPLVAALLLVSCIGNISDQGHPGGGPGQGPGAPGARPAGGMNPGSTSPLGTGGAKGGPVASVLPPGPVTLDLLDKDLGPVGPAPMRRLNRREYNNVARDLVGDVSRPADAWTAETALSGFDTDVAGQATTPAEIEQFLAAAEQVARGAIANLATLAGCDPAAIGDDACALAFIDRFASRAYRRPLAADQKMRLKTVFDQGRRGGTFADGVRLVVEAVMQSPFFLYRLEFGEAPVAGAPRVALSGPELAARLSFFLTGSMPDEPLRMAGAAGSLRTTAGIEEQARRLLAKAEARPIVANFHHQWLDLDRLDGLSKDPKLYPMYSSRVSASLQAGNGAFAQHVYIDRGDASLEELFTAPYAFVDGTSARTYGLPMSTSTKLDKVMLKEPRAGLLTDAAVMAALAGAIDTAPVGRGVFVRRSLLCQPPPSPPADMAIEVPPPNPMLTTRERYAAHRANAICAGCHRLLDTIGFGFENYDAIGRYRDVDNGKPVDASGELIGTAANDGPFRGAVELGRLLVKSRELPRCLVEGWLAYVLGRRTATEDERTVATLAGWLGGPDGKMRDLLIAITRTPTFRYRPPIVAEVCR